jgi:hypothetical protein
MQTFHHRLAATLLLAAAATGQLAAKDKSRRSGNTLAQDQILLEAHLSGADGPITRFIVTQHYDRSYVYAEREAGKPVTLIDLTQPAHPRVVSELTSPGGAGFGSLLAVAGTAALTGDAPPAAKVSQSRTIRLMDFSDAANPKVTRQFEGVTAVGELPGGLILLANAEGVWVLSQHLADDPEVERRYANKVIYGESMYR